MKLYIPELGTRFRVTRKVTLNLINESRNDSILWLLGLSNFYLKSKVITIDYELSGKIMNERMEVINTRNKEALYELNRLNHNNILFRGSKNKKRIAVLENIKKVDDEAINKGLKKVNKQIPKNGKFLEYYDFDLKPGDELVLDRIYIRKGAKDFSSVSFFLHRKSCKRLRFWLPLDQLGNINLTKI